MDSSARNTGGPWTGHDRDETVTLTHVRILENGSWITVICALLTALWSVPQVVLTGTVSLSAHLLFAVLFLFPAQIGVPVSLLLALNSILLLSRGEVDTPARRLLAWGQIITVTLLGLCALALVLPTAFGREFIVMALAFQIGQVVVTFGLALHLLMRCRAEREAAALEATERESAGPEGVPEAGPGSD